MFLVNSIKLINKQTSQVAVPLMGAQEIKRQKLLMDATGKEDSSSALDCWIEIVNIIGRILLNAENCTLIFDPDTDLHPQSKVASNAYKALTSLLIAEGFHACNPSKNTVKNFPIFEFLWKDSHPEFKLVAPGQYPTKEWYTSFTISLPE